MPMIQDQKHWLMLVWMLITGVIAFGFVVSWNEGLLQALDAGNPSRISLVIGLLYLGGMGTALFTTLAGLTGSILLGLQYLVIEKGADILLEQILRLSQSRLALG